MTEPTIARPKSVEAITLFVEDLDAAKRFYGEVLDLPVEFQDDDSAAFRFANTLVNLLRVEAVPELIAPAEAGTGIRSVFTIGVEDVDAVCTELESRGVTLLNGPMDRPWGIRTASFQDPAGHVWEVAK
ncbi:MAG TPA: VOC family protein [Micromonosporaceae bacterium]|jgi:catechol 2,3-dioxygenase-like lactoylglutathione lyase family enzyme